MLTKLTQLDFSQDVLDGLKDETMVFSASPDFAFGAGGGITKRVLDYLLGHGLFGPDDNVVIDTRVHMLKPGWFPAIPGWHCDAIPRGADGQPDFDDPAIPDIRHYLCVVDQGSGSLTDFIDFGDWLRDKLPKTAFPGENIWGAHSKHINEHIEWNSIDCEITTLESAGVYQFGPHDYHRAVPAIGHGWRYFFRASVNTKTRGPLNEIRRQVQVYMPDEDMGW